MRIEYIGHACFLATSEQGTRVVFDPYEPGAFGGAFGYGPPDVAADVVFTSHDHADHGAVGSVSGSPRHVRAAGAGEHKGVSWRGLETFHDDSRGSARGRNAVFNVTLDGLNLCHLGDLGHALSAADARQIGRVDVLFAPVGGHFTIDAAAAVKAAETLKPRVVVPMHFKTPKVSLPIAGLEDFLRAAPWPVREKGPAAELSAADMPAATEVWTMKSAR